MNNYPVVIGLDISLTSTGIAGVVPDSGRGWSFHVGEKGKDTDSWPERFRRIDSGVGEIITAIYQNTSSIDLLVVEGPAPSRSTGHVWDRAGLWNLVLWELRERAVPVAVVPPNSRAKWATGKGGGGKAEVVECMTRRYGQIWETFHGSDDEADACALVAAGLWFLGHPLADVPQINASALEVVTWPDGMHLGPQRLAAAK